MVAKEGFVILDTNILMKNPKVLSRLLKANCRVILPVTVLAELDKYKTNKSLGYNVRVAGRLIEEALRKNDGSIVLSDKHKDAVGLDLKKGDDRILSTALWFLEKGKPVVVLSEDTYVRLRAQGHGIPAASTLEGVRSALTKRPAGKKAGATWTEPAATADENPGVAKSNEKQGRYSQRPQKQSNSPPSKSWPEGGSLTVEQKRDIFCSFPELTEQTDKSGRVSYNFLASKQRRKQIARELIDSGNGYVWGQLLPEYKDRVDKSGYISIKNCSEKELRELITKVIEFLR